MNVVQRWSDGEIPVAAMAFRRRWLTTPVLILAALACIDAASPADIPVTTTDTASTGEHASAERTDEQKTQARNTVVLLAIVTGIALTGLLLVIIAVAARGLSRKMDTTEIEASPAPPDRDKAVEPFLDDAAVPTADPHSDQPPRDAP